MTCTVQIKCRINVDFLFSKVICVFFFFFFFFAVNISISVDLPCIPMKMMLELLPLESLSAILEYMFALQQQEKSKKMCHLMFSVEKFAHVTCMLDDN